MSPTKKVFLAVLVLFLLSSTVANALLIMRVWDPLWNPFRPLPEQVFAKMLQRSKELDTFRLVQNLRIGGKIAEQIIETDLRLRNDIDQSKIEQLRVNSTFLFGLSIQNDRGNLQFKLEGESIGTGDTTYLKITSLELPQEVRRVLLSEGKIDPDQFLNRWIRVNQQELLASSGIDQETIAQELRKKTELQKELQELLLSSQFYVVQQEFPDEKLQETTMYHYVVEIRLQEMVDAVLTKMFEKEQVPFGEGENPVPDVLKESIKGAVDSVLQKIGPLRLDLWIDKQTLYLRRATTTKTIDLAQFDPVLEGTLSFFFESVYSDFNRPIQVKAPQDSIPFQELLAPIFESLRSPQVLPPPLPRPE